MDVGFGLRASCLEESLRATGKRATMVCGSTRLDGELVRALTFLKSRISHGPPIQMRAALGEVIHIFTDGAFEPESEHSGTIGGVLDSEAGVRLGFFSEIVPPALLDAYLTVSKKTYLFGGVVGGAGGSSVVEC